MLRWKRGRELVHCLYKKLQTCLPTSRRPAKPYLRISDPKCNHLQSLSFASSGWRSRENSKLPNSAHSRGSDGLVSESAEFIFLGICWIENETLLSLNSAHLVFRLLRWGLERRYTTAGLSVYIIMLKCLKKHHSQVRSAKTTASVSLSAIM